MKVALVHDWLETWGGGENVLVELLAVFPGADVFALVDFLAPEDRARLGGATITASWMQSMPGARRWFRHAAVAYPQVMETFDLRGYDLIVSVSHAIAKGVRKRAGQVHVCYCNSPARFAWGMIDVYRARAAAGSRVLARGADLLLARFRRWDLRASRNVDRFIANSQNIADAIEKVYGRHADVVYPPVHVDRFAAPAEGPRTHYVTLSRLVPYKRIDLIVEAFRRLPHLGLRVIGDGPDRARLEGGRPANVEFLGRIPDGQVATELASARAFVFAAEEDFGIAPLEAQAAGTPVIAYGKGGVLETVRGPDAPNPTGSFFPEQTAESLAQAIERFDADADRYDAAACRDNAARFAPDRFRAAIRTAIASAMREHASGAAVAVGSAP
jgi:glycosyltransferase involved in cell wall biosynthesis